MRFLVETYQSSADPRTAEAAARAAAVVTEASSQRVRYVESIVVPDDEVSFHIFEAASVDDVRLALDEASIAYERIVVTANHTGAQVATASGDGSPTSGS